MKHENTYDEDLEADIKIRAAIRKAAFVRSGGFAISLALLMLSAIMTLIEAAAGGEPPAIRLGFMAWAAGLLLLMAFTDAFEKWQQM